MGESVRTRSRFGTPRFALLVLGVGILAATAGFWMHSTRIAPTMLPIEGLWLAEFKDLSGQSIKMSSLKGQPMVVNFWATWCRPCVEEMPDFQRVSQTAEGQKVKFVGIGIDYAKNMKPFADKIGISYLLLESGAQGLDIVKSIGNTAGVLPFTLVIDRSGTVVSRKVGRIEYAELMATINGLQR
jgi:peroxiredoxin